MLAVHCRRSEVVEMSGEMNRRDFLLGAEAVVVAAMLNRGYAGASAKELATEEAFWSEIGSAYGRDPKLINLNNGGVAPSPSGLQYGHPRSRPAVNRANDSGGCPST